MVTLSNDIRQQARELGQQTRRQTDMDKLCDTHLQSELTYHPLDDEFSNTPRYKTFERLVVDHAEANGFTWEECDGMEKDDFRTDVREAFDEGFYQPADRVECLECLDEGHINIRVNDAGDITADAVLDDHVQSGGVKDDENDWR